MCDQEHRSERKKSVNDSKALHSKLWIRIWQCRKKTDPYMCQCIYSSKLVNKSKYSFIILILINKYYDKKCNATIYIWIWPFRLDLAPDLQQCLRSPSLGLPLNQTTECGISLSFSRKTELLNRQLNSNSF